MKGRKENTGKSTTFQDDLTKKGVNGDREYDVYAHLSCSVGEMDGTSET